jgi:hypothetical protein
MRRLAILPCCLAAVAAVGCGGSSAGDSSTVRIQEPVVPASRNEAPGGPIGRVALHAAQVVDPRDCPRWYEAGNGVTICRDYITAGSRQAHAVVRSVTRIGDKAVAEMGEPGGNPFALTLTRTGGRWRVYDEAGFLPAIGD